MQLPVDRDGHCLPWFTYPSITFLKDRIQSDMSVFEYGSGNSTLWWGERVSRVVSCEHDLEWFHAMKDKVPANVDYRHFDLVPGGEYCKAVLAYDAAFDVIVIDGRDRTNCIKNALGALRDKGVVIWDNSDRVAYQDGYDYLIQNGFKRLDFMGMGPIGFNPWCTSVFYKENNCFNI
jgi:predicted O-methyltransferase YrrM